MQMSGRGDEFTLDDISKLRNFCNRHLEIPNVGNFVKFVNCPYINFEN